MPEQTTEASETEVTSTEETSVTTTEDTGGDTDLGDAGKKALSAERTARKAAEKEAAEHKAEIARLRRTNAATKGTDLDGIKAEMRSEFTAQLVRAEVKAAASGRLTDPADALRLLDLDGLSAIDSGEIDEAAIKAAIDKLLTDKPYLAATSGEAQWGDVGSGQRKTSESEPTSAQDRMARAYGRKTR